MISIEKNSEMPVYEQVAQNITDLIIKGEMKPGDRIPSVRLLARSLGLNPNTVQKSYTNLLENNIIYSVKGKGNFVSDNVNALRFMKKKELLARLCALTKEAKESGMWIDELLSAVDAAYTEN